MNRSSLPAAAAVLAGAAALAAAGFGAAPAAATPGVDRTPAFTYVSPLEALLPTARQLTHITGSTSPMRVVGSATEFTATRGTLEPTACLGAFEPGHRDGYAVQPSGIAGQIAADGKPGRARHYVHQVVLGTADTETATAQLRASTRAWSRCGAQTITFTSSSGKTVQWRLDPAELHRDNTVLVQRQVGRGIVCERAMSAATAKDGGVVADVLACDLRGGEPAGRAEQIALTIAGDSAPTN
ncbi:sensor domain-containing protein [Mycolicibacterium sp.]|uniref:sensor domain-containing protein n=1 Tax=Mycolicibacterium sp. TaxID=2320850 RepID=UPI00355DD578